MNDRKGPASRRKETAVKLTLLFVSLCICLAATELVLQKIIPLDDGTSYQFRMPHPVLGWVLEPDTSYHNTLREETVHVKYNSRGWRDDEHSFENPEGVFRILVLGDSFMEAYSVNLDESFPKRLEEFAGKLEHTVEVINFGVGGYGSLQEYLAFTENGKQYKPDLVLVGFYVGNDVRNNSLELESIINEPGTRPFLGPGRSGPWSITQTDITDARLLYKAARARLETIPYKLAEHSILLSKVLKEYERVVSRHSENRDDDPKPANKALEDMALMGVHYCEEPPEYSRAWDITKRILSRLKNDVEAIGSRLVVFTVPSIQETGPPDPEQLFTGITDPEKICIEDPPGYKRLGRVLAELDIDLIDLLPDFRKAMQEDNINLFRQSDRHWNNRGHSLAAGNVLKKLMEKNLIHGKE